MKEIKYMNDNQNQNEIEIKNEKKVKIKKPTRIKGIPDTPLLRCYTLPPSQMEDDKLLCVGFDSGITNAAYSYLSLIKDENTKAIVDFNYEDSYYFKDELEDLGYKINKQFYIVNKYQELFSKRLVQSVTFELLALKDIPDEVTFKGVLDAQNTTALLMGTAYSLHHTYQPVPPTALKYCLTGNGKASKEEMKVAAYNLTGDERLLENDHMADAFADAFYGFIKLMKEDCVYYNVPIPDKFKHMTWNFINMPLAPWNKGNKN